jgi:hypothetical protein
MRLLWLPLIPALSGFTSFADGPRLHLPKEALDACAGRAAGDPCTMALFDNQVFSKCRLLEDGATLACVPPPPAPPREAIAACAGHRAGEACSFAGFDRTLSGTCSVVPDLTELACMPAFGVRFP